MLKNSTEPNLTQKSILLFFSIFYVTLRTCNDKKFKNSIGSIAMKKLFLISALAVAFYVQTNTSAPQIIYTISPPRSLSVAFLRCIETLGGFHIMHEPSQACFVDAWCPEYNKFFKENNFKSYQHVAAEIISRSAMQRVFVKEMSFSVAPFISNHLEFVAHPDIQFILLLRNPHHSTISFYKRKGETNKLFSYLIGYKSLYEIFLLLKQHAKRPPILIKSEDLYENTQATLTALCASLEIPYDGKPLMWNDLGNDFAGTNEWQELKCKDAAQHWHGSAIRSTGITKPNIYAIDEHGQPTFEEITNVADRAACKQAYEENLPYYLLLKQESTFFLR